MATTPISILDLDEKMAASYCEEACKKALFEFLKEMSTWNGTYPPHRPKEVDEIAWGGWSSLIRDLPGRMLETKDVNVRTDETGCTDTLLAWALQLQWSGLVLLLLKCGADPDAIINTTFHETAFHNAVWNCNARNVELLLQYGGNPKKSKCRFGSLLDMAIRWRDFQEYEDADKVVELLRPKYI